MITIEQLDNLLHLPDDSAFEQCLQEYGYDAIGIFYMFPSVYFVDNLETFLEVTGFDIPCLMYLPKIEYHSKYLSDSNIQRLVRLAHQHELSMSDFFQHIRSAMDVIGYLHFYGCYASLVDVQTFQQFVTECELRLAPFVKPKEYYFNEPIFSSSMPVNDGWAFYMQYNGYWDAMTLNVYDRLPFEAQQRIPPEYQSIITIARQLQSTQPFREWKHMEHPYHDEVPLLM